MSYSPAGIQGAPDWVMCGMPWSDGQVAIFVSRELSQAELNYEAHIVELGDFGSFDMHYAGGGHRFALTVEGDTRSRPDGQARFVIVTAATYGEALAHLLSQWQPDAGPVAQLPKGEPS